ncbi:DnaJ C-terminal domain-containing protein [Pontixanthobacter sp.]|uniref:DnaJ C-terminal domain-containing protein n=1 Tax=Pontixanthobacter sp. TaxID=2792078 RepID=UPI003C7E928A
MSDPYATLGVARSASESEIKSAYRKLAKELHPDKNKDNPKATERFSAATQAYDLLSDKTKRAQFDRGEIDGDGNPASPFGGGGFGGSRGHSGMGGMGGRSTQQGGFNAQDFEGFTPEGVDLGDIFEGLFGGAGARSQSGPSGFGRRPPPPPPRKGAEITYRLRVPFIDAARLTEQRITLADGKTIDMKLPAGVEDGTKVRLKGKGEKGAGGAGDGIVVISIDNHAFFRRDGSSVRMDLPITLDEAVNGAKIKVPTVDGAVMMTLKPGTNGGTVLRLKGKGFSAKDGARGDQLVTLEITLPEDLSELNSRLDGWHDHDNPRKQMGV